MLRPINPFRFKIEFFRIKHLTRMPHLLLLLSFNAYFITATNFSQTIVSFSIYYTSSSLLTSPSNKPSPKKKKKSRNKTMIEIQEFGVLEK